ncbi:MAG TPA: hypothetical protein VKZ68_08855 [Ohtaekwangia sp.]|nr:hypothetical protein [Ohtaekwangia sp.]
MADAGTRLEEEYSGWRGPWRVAKRASRQRPKNRISKNTLSLALFFVNTRRHFNSRNLVLKHPCKSALSITTLPCFVFLTAMRYVSTHWESLSKLSS